jgi:hypothetical protein
MSGFDHPRPAPSAFTFTAVESRYSVYGWSAALRRPALEFSTLRVRGRRGFSLTGSGRASVGTPPLFRPGGIVKVAVSDAHGNHSRRLRAESSGRLTVRLSLGRGNFYQQFSPRAALAPRRSLTADVRIEGLG